MKDKDEKLNLQYIFFFMDLSHLEESYNIKYSKWNQKQIQYVQEPTGTAQSLSSWNQKFTYIKKKKA